MNKPIVQWTQEQIDLAAMNQSMIGEMQLGFWILNRILNMKDEEISAAGYKTRDAAIVDQVNSTINSVYSLKAKFFKQYPHNDGKFVL